MSFYLRSMNNEDNKASHIGSPEAANKTNKNIGVKYKTDNDFLGMCEHFRVEYVVDRVPGHTFHEEKNALLFTARCLYTKWQYRRACREHTGPLYLSVLKERRTSAIYSTASPAVLTYEMEKDALKNRRMFVLSNEQKRKDEFRLRMPTTKQISDERANDEKRSC